MAENQSDWRLEVLRPLPRVTHRGNEIALGERGGAALEVAVYLILTRHRETSRQELIEVFRGRSGGGFDRERLRRLLHTLRRTFGEEAIGGGDALRWQLPIETDADELLRSSPERMEAELPLYVEDFLSEWEKSGHSGRFAAWLRERREEYRSRAFNLLDARARLSRDAGKWDEVCRTGARMSALWPTREEGHLWEALGLEGAGDLSRAETSVREAQATLGKHSAALSSLGERLRLCHEDEITRRAGASPALPTRADVGPADEPTASPREGPADRAEGEAVRSDDGAADRANGAADASAEPAPGLAPNAMDHPSREVDPGAVYRLDRPGPDSPPLHARRPGPRRALAVGLLAVICVATGWLAWRLLGQGDGRGVCHNGLGRASLVRDIYQIGSGIDAGFRFHKGWILQNDGACRWEPSFPVVRQRSDTPGAPRLIAPADTLSLHRRVLPGDTVWISVPLTAPNVLAHIRERWSILDASGSSITVDGSPYLAVDVLVHPRDVPPCAPGDLAAEMVASSHDERQVIAAGTEFVGGWTLINPRTCSWPADVALVRVGAGPGPLSGDTSRVQAGEPILPGETNAFRVPMRAPLRPSTYAEEWELVAPGGRRVPVSGVSSVRINVSVVSPGQSAQLRTPLCGQSRTQAAFESETLRDSATLPRDHLFTKVWTLGNSGTCRWTEGMVLRFDSAQGRRMSLVDEVPVTGTVLPGRTHAFVVPSRTPVDPGTYSEYWSLRDRYGERVTIPNLDAVWMTIRVR